MSRKDKINFIKRIATELGEVQLGGACGKYFSIVDNGTSVLALSFVGKYGYGSAVVDRLNGKTIDAIYGDLVQDFA